MHTHTHTHNTTRRHRCLSPYTSNYARGNAKRRARALLSLTIDNILRRPWRHDEQLSKVKNTTVGYKSYYVFGGADGRERAFIIIILSSCIDLSPPPPRRGFSYIYLIAGRSSSHYTRSILRKLNIFGQNRIRTVLGRSGQT